MDNIQAQLDPDRANPYTNVLSVTMILDNNKHILLESAHIVDLYFIEDIFSFIITGKIRFYDLYNLQETGPLVGTEAITVIYGGLQQRQIVFKLYDIKYHQTTDTNPTEGPLIEASFVDTSFETMLDTHYSRSFPKGQTYTTMVKFMLMNFCQWPESNIQMEESSNESPEAFAIPYWTIAMAAKFLLKRAIGKTSRTSGYLIYNSTQNNHSVNVKTLNYLFSQFNSFDADTYHFESSGDNIRLGQFKKNKILEWEIEGRSRSGSSALYGGRWRGIDTSKGTMITDTYKFSEGIAETMLLGKKSLCYNESDTSRMIKTSAERNLVELHSVCYDEWSRAYNSQNKASLLILGNERRYCGHLINLEWPSYDLKTEIYQKQLQGLWLVRGITHMFKPAEPIPYIQKMVLLKNAYTYSESTQLISSTKKNVTGGVKTKFLDL